MSLCVEAASGRMALLPVALAEAGLAGFASSLEELSGVRVTDRAPEHDEYHVELAGYRAWLLRTAASPEVAWLFVTRAAPRSPCPARVHAETDGLAAVAALMASVVRALGCSAELARDIGLLAYQIGRSLRF
jgi:hypothetical protein